MELLANPDWTETATLFLKKVLHIIRLNVKPCQISTENVIQSEYGDHSPLKEILFYIKILSEMTIMKKNYGINISILEYIQVSHHLLRYH